MPVLKEVAVASWRNDADDVCGLGCATSFNEQDPNLIFTVLLDEEKERIFARLGLSVMVKGGGNRKLRGFDFLVPLDARDAEKPDIDVQTISVSDIQDDSIRAAVAHARLAKSGRIIRVGFTLGQHGVVVTPWKEEQRFTACSDTTLDLLSGLFSLSESQSFTLYVALSDYAEAGLRMLTSVLQTGKLEQWLPEATGIYGGRQVMTVTREQVESGLRPRNRGKKAEGQAQITEPRGGKAAIPSLAEHPPPYPQAALLVPRTPPSDLIRRIASPTNSILAEDSCVSDRSGVLHIGTTEVEGEVRGTGKRKRTDEDQETLKATFDRRLQQWFRLAFKENDRVYDHTILRPFFDETVPSCVAECDLQKFNVGIAYATAVFACDPQGTCDQYWAHKDDFFNMVDDVRALVLWSIQRNPGEEVRCWRSFMDLGAAACAAMQSGDRASYNEIKAGITTKLVMGAPTRAAK